MMESIRTSPRLRSACDLCHQGKIRCSGGMPCSTCQKDPARCLYSPSIRVGRPRGSKNKRTLRQEKNNDRLERQDDASGNDTVTDQWQDTAQQQQQQHQSLDIMSFELELDQDNEPTFADSLVSKETHDSLIDPKLGLLDSMGGIGDAHQGLTRDNDDSAFDFCARGLPESETRCSAQLLADSLLDFDSHIFSTFPNLSGSYPEAPSALSESSINDSGYSTGAVSPHEATFPGGNPETPASFIPTSPSRCTCLQRLAKLLYQLGDLQFYHADSFAMDSLLRGVQLAQAPWKALMDCRRCQKKDSQPEAFLLFVTSIRMLLSPIQKLNASTRRAGVFSKVSVTMGNFEMMGKAKDEVISVAIRQALQTMTSALFQFWELTSHSRSLPASDLGGTGTDPGTPVSILTGKSQESQRARSFSSSASPNGGADNIVSLLHTLQYTINSLQQKS